MNISKFLSMAFIIAGIGMALGLPKVNADTHWPTSLTDCQERFERISFCHATSSRNNPYNFHYNQPCTAAFGSGQGNSGHFEEGGTTSSGHENDYFTDDSTCGGTITPTPVPVNEPSASVQSSCGEVTLNFKGADLDSRYQEWVFDYRVDSEPFVSLSPWNGLPFNSNSPLFPGSFGERWHLVTIAEDGEDSVHLTFPEDSGNHLVEYRLAEGAEQSMYFDWRSVTVESDCKTNTTPTPTPTTENLKSDLSVIDPNCSSDQVKAFHKIKINDKDQEGMGIVFKYNGQEQKFYTGSNGEAVASFTYTGDGYLDSIPDGWSGKSHYVTKETDCSAVGGVVLGTSTEGQVLGAYAETGIAEDVMMSILGLAGAGMFTTGAVLHVKKRA